MNEMFAVLGIGIALGCFLLVILALGSFAGGDWEAVAQGVTLFFAIIVTFCLGAFGLVKVMERR